MSKLNLIACLLGALFTGCKSSNPERVESIHAGLAAPRSEQTNALAPALPSDGGVEMDTCRPAKASSVCGPDGIGKGVEKCGLAPICKDAVTTHNYNLENHYFKVDLNEPFKTVQGTVMTVPELAASDFCRAHFDGDFEFEVDVSEPARSSVLAPQNAPEYEGGLPVEVERAFLFPEVVRDAASAMSRELAVLPGPKKGAPIAVRGALIWDCGHRGGCGFYSEIHPPVAMAWVQWPTETAAGFIEIRVIGWEILPSTRRGLLDSFEASFSVPSGLQLSTDLKVEPTYAYEEGFPQAVTGCRLGVKTLATDQPRAFIFPDAAEPSKAFEWFSVKSQLTPRALDISVKPTAKLGELHTPAGGRRPFPPLAGFRVALVASDGRTSTK